MKLLIILTAALFLNGCANTLETKTTDCFDGRTMLDDVCVKNEVADYVSCVRARGTELKIAKSKIVSAEVGYFGFNVSGANKENETHYKKIKSTSKEVMAIILQCKIIVTSINKPIQKTIKKHDYLVANTALTWNNALYDGNIKLAMKYTSKTSKNYINKYFGSITNMSKDFQISDNRPKCSVNNQLVRGSVAVSSYICYYPDSTVKQWSDTLFFENGLWKVAPQFAKMIPVKGLNN